MLENSLTSGDIGAFIGAPRIHRNYNGKEFAFDNLALGAALLRGYHSELQYARISCEPINSQRDLMPEASWVFRLFYEDTYFARIGMNLHREGSDIVASITNIQGQNKRAIREMKTHCELWSVYCLADIIKNLPPEITVFRGMPAQHHHSANIAELSPELRAVRLASMSKLYDPTFLNLKFEPIFADMNELRWMKKDRASTATTPPSTNPPPSPDSPAYYELRRTKT